MYHDGIYVFVFVEGRKWFKNDLDVESFVMEFSIGKKITSEDLTTQHKGQFLLSLYFVLNTH